MGFYKNFYIIEMLVFASFYNFLIYFMLSILILSHLFYSFISIICDQNNNFCP